MLKVCSRAFFWGWAPWFIDGFYVPHPPSLHHLSPMPVWIPVSSHKGTSHMGSAFTWLPSVILITALRLLSPSSHIPSARGKDFYLGVVRHAFSSNTDPSVVGKDEDKHKRGFWASGKGHFSARAPLCGTFHLWGSLHCFDLPCMVAHCNSKWVTEGLSQERNMTHENMDYLSLQKPYSCWHPSIRLSSWLSCSYQKIWRDYLKLWVSFPQTELHSKQVLISPSRY